MLAPNTGPDASASSGLARGWWRVWRGDVAETLRLAWPMALTQLGQVAMMTTDLVLLGHLGATVVAAVSLAHTVLFMAFTIGLGPVSAVAPLASQAFGARQPRMVRRAARIGLWAVVAMGLPLTLMQMWGEQVLLLMGQSPDVAAIAGRYLASLAWCVMPGWAFIVLRNFMSAVNRPEPALWITLAAIPANAALAALLIFGGFGVPALDVLGAGLATTLVNIGMCGAALVVCWTRRPFRKYHVLARFWRPDWALARQLFALGGPISGSFLLEFGAFAGAALLMGHIGTVALAAHQIALQVAAVLFMVPFGISMAATVRAGQAVGRRDMPAARRAGFAACGIGLAFMSFMTLVVAAFRDSIPLLFLSQDSAAASETLALAALLLALATSFFMADGLQTIAAGALRGLNDTRVPLIFAGISFWPIGMLTGVVLAFKFGFGAVGVWIGLSLGLFVQAVLLVSRFDILTRRGRLPDIPGSA